MTFFSNKPNLVLSPQINNIVLSNTVPPLSGGNVNSFKTISEYISDFFLFLFNNIFLKNKLASLYIIALFIFLFYRYYNKKYDNFSHNIFYDDVHSQTSHLHNNIQPSLNNIKSVNSQNKHTINYIPDNIPLNIPSLSYDSNDNFNLVSKNKLSNDPSSFTTLNIPEYPHDIVYSKPSLSYYNNASPRSFNSSDNIVNPLGFDTNFNETTNRFVDYMIDNNYDNINNYNSIISNKNNNLVKSSINDLIIDPPYN